MSNLYDLLKQVGLGSNPSADVQAIAKALSSGYATSPSGQIGGGALRIESLENTMHTLTFTEKHLVLWKDIPKDKAYSTVEEYNVLNDYGQNAGFWLEGEKPEESTGDYQRKVAFVKFVGTARSVTHPMTLVNATQDPLNIETLSGVREVLKHVESGLFWGNADSATGVGNYVEWDGLYNQIANVYDAYGKTFDKELMDEIGVKVTENFGLPTDMYMSFKALSKFRRIYDNVERMIHPGSENNATAGITINKLLTAVGDINLKPSVLINSGFALGQKPAPTASTSPKAPGAPTLTASVVASASSTVFQEGAGSYTYKVTLINRFGESAPATAVAAVVNANDEVTLTITNAASGEAPEQAAIYRSNVDGSDCRLVARIPLDTNALGGTTTWVDDNKIVAGTEVLFLIDNTPDVWRFKALSPMVRMQLAQIAPAIRFMLLMYGVPILYAPKKAVVVTNVQL